MTNAPEHSVCPKCPLAVASRVAKRLLEENRASHQDPRRALGGIILTEQALQGVVAEVGCPSPETGPCPNEDATYKARNMAAATWPEASYSLRLDEIIPPYAQAWPNADTGGQYL